MTVTDWLCIAFIVWVLLYPLGARFSTRGYEVIKVKSSNTEETGALILQDLEPGKLYSVVRPSVCRGDIVLAVRENSSSKAANKIVVLTCRQPFSRRAPFVGSPPSHTHWVFEPAPADTVVTIENE